MMRLIALLGIVSLLVCRSAGQDAANVEEEEDFKDLYPADRAHGFKDVNGMMDDEQHLHSATKRDVSDRQREIDLAAQQPFYPYGRRTDVPGRPTGFIFGKRGQYFIPYQYQKRELAEVNPYSVSKRDEELTGLEEELDASKRSSGPYMSGLHSLTFGKRDAWGPEKRRDPFSSYAFGKRAFGSSLTFGKRGYGMSSFDFGKRAGLDSSFTFGKRAIPDVDRYDEDALVQDDKRAFGSSLTFGKRNGLSSFTFGKRAGER
ncbi:uncharacterized protein LOC110983600 [Acanthaster planci]|uniref:Uncharacterized protein LOC110983600 n=1 Tax=Acanthaster planci TaxID=133434 RepID=A0A8B7Z5P4_ACAPL|nr:uncharacterized protein LOC110983600 [Acanthaster planci]XP_022098657.1 uncharacterized protein LOC110983600 [Acanthaster planci]